MEEVQENAYPSIYILIIQRPWINATYHLQSFTNIYPMKMRGSKYRPKTCYAIIPNPVELKNKKKNKKNWSPVTFSYPGVNNEREWVKWTHPGNPKWPNLSSHLHSSPATIEPTGMFCHWRIHSPELWSTYPSGLRDSRSSWNTFRKWRRPGQSGRSGWL